jgi:alpha-glucosidase (family GH31 glycosyl hydrolase)
MAVFGKLTGRRSFLPGIILLVLVIFCSLSKAKEHPLQPGNLVSQLPSSQHIIGDFRWNFNHQEKVIRVSHQSDTNHLLWSSIPGKAFLAAGIGQEHFKDKRGTFILKEHFEKNIFQHLELNAVLQEQGRLITTFSLSNDKGQVIFGRVIWEASKEGHLIWHFECESPINRAFGFWQGRAEEHIIGMGEQPTHFNHKGNHVPVLVQEQGIGRGDIKSPLVKLVLGASTGNYYTTYKAVPHYISSAGQSLYLRNSAYAEFDFRLPDVISVKVFDQHLTAAILPGKTPADFISAYTDYAGRMRRLPEWVHSGAIIGMQGGTEKVYAVWKLLKEAGTPISAFWLQDWVGQRKTILGQQLWWNWELDQQHYPNWKTLRKDLSDADISLMGYINPFLVDVAGDKPQFQRNLYREALDSGFLVLDRKGAPYMNVTSFKAALLDLSHPGCRQWVKELIKSELIGNGFRGWMADFGEALPFDVSLKNISSTAGYHNLYAQDWAQINREAIEEAGLGDDLTFFSRAAFTQSPAYSTLFWQGDQMVNWGKNDGLPSAITGLLSGGVSGFSLNHSDIGGYASIVFPLTRKIKRSPELLHRWMQLSAFTTVFRTHEGLGPANNHQVYSDSLSAMKFAYYAKVHQAWKGYRHVLLEEAAEKGWPVVRPMAFEFPQDPVCWAIGRSQFMLGDAFLVVPVIQPGEDKIRCYFPTGVWVNAWNGSKVISDGQWMEEHGYADKPGVFYKDSSKYGPEFAERLKDLGAVPK